MSLERKLCNLFRSAQTNASLLSTIPICEATSDAKTAADLAGTLLYDVFCGQYRLESGP